MESSRSPGPVLVLGVDCEDLFVFAKQFSGALASGLSSKPEEGLYDPKLAAQSGLGRRGATTSRQTDTYVSQRSALGIPKFIPSGHCVFPRYLSTGGL